MPFGIRSSAGIRNPAVEVANTPDLASVSGEKPVVSGPVRNDAIVRSAGVAGDGEHGEVRYGRGHRLGGVEHGLAVEIHHSFAIFDGGSRGARLAREMIVLSGFVGPAVYCSAEGEPVGDAVAVQIVAVHPDFNTAHDGGEIPRAHFQRGEDNHGIRPCGTAGVGGLTSGIVDAGRVETAGDFRVHVTRSRRCLW